MTESKRIVFIDLAKGFCILLVVLYHVYGDLSGDVINMMTLFRMPLYFVLSGLFFKPYDGFWSFFKKKTNKLLIPFSLCFFFFNVPTTLFLDWQSGQATPLAELFLDDANRLYLGINKAIWFLWCLFIVNIYFYLITLISKNRLSIMVALSSICGITGWGLCMLKISLPLWFDTALTAVPFFMMGYVLRHYGDMLYSQMSKKDYAYSGLCLFLLICIFYMNKMYNTVNVNYIFNEYDVDPITIYLGGFVGTYFVLMLSKCLGHVPVISYIGRYSIVVLITHQAYRFFIRNILYQAGVPQDNPLLNFGVFIFLVLIELPTIKYGIRYLPVCFAQKDLWK